MMEQGRQRRVLALRAAGRALARITAVAGPLNDESMRAYAGHLANRVPVLYTLVFVNNAILAARYYGSAPTLLTLWLPVISALPLLLRALYWLPSRVERRSIEQLRGDLRSLGIVGPAVAFLCTLWALSLYSYGDALQRSLVHYIVAITSFASILGLAQSPGTALRMALASLGPATLWFLWHDHPNAFAICAVQVFAGLLVLLVTYGYHRDFVALEASRREIARRELEASNLASLMSDRASHDPLTGVANRRAILARLEECMADRSQPSPWLALLDLDGFKYVNDTFGHAAGDAVLQSVCRRLEEVSGVISFGRLGGDEFAILLPGSLAPAEARLTLTDLIARISQPIAFERYQLAVTASIGLRLTQRRAVNECLERADTALYAAKRTPGVVVEFSEADEKALGEQQALTRAFSSADLDGQISLVYQPTVDIDTGKIESFEACSRWSPDGKSMLQPGDFLGLAQNTGRIRELSTLILRRALAECQVWTRGCSLSINLSAQDMIDDSAPTRFARLAHAAGAPPSAIIFEITERALPSDTGRAAEILLRLREHGFRIALDDFGTGQSSLARVHQLPLDQLKIDRSFAQGIETDKARRAIASTILSLARQLGLACTIEGIETAAQAAGARALGIRSMQGYHFGRPVPPAQALMALRAA